MNTNNTTIGDEVFEPMATFGQIQEFVPDAESISTYVERLQLFFEANDISGKKVQVLSSITGTKNYVLLRSLLALTLPRDKSFNDTVKTLKQHFEPKPSIIAEHFIFIAAISS